MQFQRPHEGGGAHEAGWATFVAAGTITEGQLVMLDVDATGDDLGVDVLAATADSEYLVGVALESVVENQVIRVQCYGTNKNVTTDGGVSQGDYIESDANGAGDTGATEPIATEGLYNKLGIALKDDVSTVGIVFIKCM
jgi:hypothetical protein